MPADVARYILSLDFPAADHARYSELALKAQDGALTSAERVEIESFLDISDLLAIMQAKARTSLKHVAAAPE